MVGIRVAASEAAGTDDRASAAGPEPVTNGQVSREGRT